MRYASCDMQHMICMLLLVSIKVAETSKSSTKNSKSKRKASAEHLITLNIKLVVVMLKYFMKNCHGKNLMIQHSNLAQ